jgi:hypothetical protein
VWERQGSRLLAFECFRVLGFVVLWVLGLWAFWVGWVVGVFVVSWVLGLWELPVYTTCVLRGALRFHKVLRYLFNKINEPHS